MTNYCACGCGTKIADGNTWVHGHNTRDPTTKKKISESMMGKKNSLGCIVSNVTREKMSESAVKHWEDPLEREKISQTMKNNFQNPDFKERHHMWYNHEDPDDGVVMLSPYSHRHGHAFLKACGVEIEHIMKEEI